MAQEEGVLLCFSG